MLYCEGNRSGLKLVEELLKLTRSPGLNGLSCPFGIEQERGVAPSPEPS